jgi:phosphopantetheinyl transferase (holo-ACP synthase)
MIRVAQLDQGVWMGAVVPVEPASLVGRARRLADRRAGRVARLLALRAAGLARPAATVSSAHSAGAGAAVAAPRHVSVGIDVIPIGRLEKRHAQAVLSARELRLLDAIPPALVPALAWTLKEAAAKATAHPALYFPAGLRIRDANACSATIELVETPDVAFTAKWFVSEAFLFSWVLRAALPTQR